MITQLSTVDLEITVYMYLLYLVPLSIDFPATIADLLQLAMLMFQPQCIVPTTTLCVKPCKVFHNKKSLGI